MIWIDIRSFERQCLFHPTGMSLMHEARDPVGVGRAIRGLRRDKGWTQDELASWLGVNRQTIISLERGGPVSLPVAMKAISILGAKVLVVPKDFEARG